MSKNAMIYWTIDIINLLWTWISIAHRTSIIIFCCYSAYNCGQISNCHTTAKRVWVWMYVCYGMYRFAPTHHYNPRMMWPVIIQGSPATLYTTATLLVEHSTCVLSDTDYDNHHCTFSLCVSCLSRKGCEAWPIYQHHSSSLIAINCEVSKIIRSYHLKYIFAL